jgi:hypothetical protein
MRAGATNRFCSVVAGWTICASSQAGSAIASYMLRPIEP